MNHKRFLAFVLALVMVFGYVPVGASAEGNAPSLPGATVTEVENDELTFAMNFKADEVTDEQLAYYGDWFADFELTVNRDVTFNANGGADGYLSGQYDAWSENWVNVPFENVSLKANEPMKIMEFAAEMLGEPGLKLTYADVYNGVKDFDCGVFFEPAFLAANPGLEVSLSLKMYNPDDASEVYAIGETYEFEVAGLPTATVTQIEHDELTFAMNFKADEVTDEQLAYYGDWFADFELTVNKNVTFNANGGADGYLSGQYDAYGENWVNVPFENVTLEAHKPLKIMEYASKLMNESGLKYTYAEVYEVVRDFSCGVFFEPAFLADNPDLEVTLNLKMYDPTDESVSYVIGETYEFEIPALPTATVTEIENEELTFAMNFKADEVNEDQLAYYGDWFADFELIVNKNVTFNANGGADGYLSGQYDAYGENWVNVPFENVTLEAHKPLKIMEYASSLMGESGLKYTYAEVYEVVRDFSCGVFFEPAFLLANPDLEVTLSLKMYDPADESVSHGIGDTYVYGLEDFVAINVKTGKCYTDVSDALVAAESGDKVQLLKNAGDRIVTVLEDTIFDLNGFELEAEYVASFGDIIDGSAENSGRLIVDARRFLVQEDNAQLPVNTPNGYLLASVETIKQAMTVDKKYAFQPFVETSAHAALRAGKAVSGITVEVLISWKQENGTRSQGFEYNDDFVQGFLDSYNSASNKYSKMFTLLLSGADKLEDLQFQAVLRSETGVMIRAEGIRLNVTEKPEEGGGETEGTKIGEEQTLATGDNKAVVPAGALMENGATELKLITEKMDSTTGNITVGSDETLSSINVHVEGLSAKNEVPVIVTLAEAAPTALNQGNLTLYHVENKVSVPMTRVETLSEVDAHNEYYYDIATGTITMALKSFSEITVRSTKEKLWKGGIDTSWYDANKTVYEIYNADQLAGFGAIVGGMAKDENGNAIQDSFKGKTVNLLVNINLGDVEEDNSDLLFYPIGYYNSTGSYTKVSGGAVTSGFKVFEGTFDGNGHVIRNFYQNTWEMFGDYNDGYTGTPNHFCDGMGLFGRVYRGTVKNLTVANFSSDGEYTTTGTIAAYADGATFENISIFDCNPRVYNIGNGGIVGCVGWYAKEAGLKTTFTNITVDNSNKISALWGSWDVACGGILGQYYPTSGQSSVNYPVNAGIHMENCHVSAQIDVYNDVCANYQYYAYRYAGMLIGSIRENETIDDREYPKMDNITASGCTVHFGDWNDYYYCELVANSQASYTHDYQMSRLTQVASVDVENGTVTALDGTTTAIPTDGRVNYVVVRAKDAHGLWVHGDGPAYADCYHFVDGVQHFHNDYNSDGVDDYETVDGESVLVEDKQLVYREFNQLFTGYGWGVTSKGLSDYKGIDKMDITQGTYDESVKKFECKVGLNIATGSKFTLGQLFKNINGEIPVKSEMVQVTVSPWGDGSTVSGTYVPYTEIEGAKDWTEGTLTFSGTGQAIIVITDYYFCIPTIIQVEIGSNEDQGDWA